MGTGNPPVATTTVERMADLWKLEAEVRGQSPEARAAARQAISAPIVAELFALYREPGFSLTRLAMHLDQRGVPTPTGTPRWSSPTIRGILRNPTL